MGEKLQGWKTIIASGLTAIYGVLAMLGVHLPGDFADETTGAIMAVMGVVFTVLRAITDGPVGWRR